MRVYLFPGQGSQTVGMGKALADAHAIVRETFEEADDALKQKLTRLMFEGPESDLTLTENAQPAILAVSVAVARLLSSAGGLKLTGSYVAGHSLGEYSALAVAGAFSFADALRLVKIRGQAMQRAVPVGAGGMAALLGLEPAEAEAIAAEAAEHQVCSLANDNAPGQIVISGHAEAIDRAVALAAAKGKKAIRLQVSAPFHCALMQPAADAMQAALADTPPLPPEAALVANITAEPSIDPARIRDQLVAQVTGRVRWRESLLKLRALGATQAVELGAGNVLAGLNKRIDREFATASLGTPDAVDAFLKTV